MKKVFFTACILISTLLMAQEELDVVKLKSGGFYQGVISEYLPGDSLTMKLPDGRVVSFKDEEIQDISPRGKRFIQVKDKAFYNLTSLGWQLGQTNHYNMLSFSFNTVFGYKLHRNNIGVGTGVEAMLEQLFIPVFADYIFDFNDNDLSPFIELQGGYVFNPSNEEGGYDYYYGYHNSYNGGPMLGLHCGIRKYFRESIGMTFSVGYRYYSLTSEEYPVYLGQNTPYPVVNNAELHRLCFKVGVFLN